MWATKLITITSKKKKKTKLITMNCNKKKTYNDLCLVYNVEAFLEVSYRHNPNIKMSQV